MFEMLRRHFGGRNKINFGDCLGVLELLCALFHYCVILIFCGRKLFYIFSKRDLSNSVFAEKAFFDFAISCITSLGIAGFMTFVAMSVANG
jgi:hypothetical protein